MSVNSEVVGLKCRLGGRQTMSDNTSWTSTVFFCYTLLLRGYVQIIFNSDILAFIKTYNFHFLFCKNTKFYFNKILFFVI